MRIKNKKNMIKSKRKRGFETLALDSLTKNTLGGV